jgi:hypothetical protein
MHWVKAWLDAIALKPNEKSGVREPDDSVDMAERLQRLEERLKELEKKDE